MNIPVDARSIRINGSLFVSKNSKRIPDAFAFKSQSPLAVTAAENVGEN